MVNTREIAREYRLSHWAEIMRERVESGLTIKAFCRQVGICTNTYHYWQRRVRAAALELLPSDNEITVVGGKTVSFTEAMLAAPVLEPSVPPAREPVIGKLYIEVGGVQITADSTYPTEKLATLLRELG